MKRLHGKQNTKIIPIIHAKGEVKNVNVKEIKTYFGLAPNDSK